MKHFFLLHFFFPPFFPSSYFPLHPPFFPHYILFPSRFSLFSLLLFLLFMLVPPLKCLVLACKKVIVHLNTHHVCTTLDLHTFFIDSESTPSDSVPHHLLDTRWSVLQREGCGGCDRRSGQSPEENWKQTYTSPLQVRGMCMHLHYNMLCFPNSSDTVTRSGMFCALATVIDRCKTEGIVDVFQVVKALRTSKPDAVPTMVRCFHMIFIIIIGNQAVFSLQHMFTSQSLYHCHSALLLLIICIQLAHASAVGRS